MALSKSFKLAELIRHIEYDSTDDVIKTSKKTEDNKPALGLDLISSNIFSKKVWVS